MKAVHIYDRNLKHTESIKKKFEITRNLIIHKIIIRNILVYLFLLFPLCLCVLLLGTYDLISGIYFTYHVSHIINHSKKALFIFIAI